MHGGPVGRGCGGWLEALALLVTLVCLRLVWLRLRLLGLGLVTVAVSHCPFQSLDPLFKVTGHVVVP